MQNQKTWNKPNNTAAGFSREHSILNGRPIINISGTACALSLGPEPLVFNNDSSAYPQNSNISSNLHANTSASELQESTVISLESDEIEIIPDNSISTTNNWTNSSSLLQQTDCSFVDTNIFVGNHINKQHEESKSYSKPLPHELPIIMENSALHLPSGLPKSKKNERRNSLPPNCHGLKRKLSTGSDITSCNIDEIEQNSSNSSCDLIGPVDSTETLVKPAWTSCYSPYRKRTASVVSSERGINSLINKLFTEEEKQRYLASKKKSQSIEESKRFKYVGIDTTHKYFFNEVAGTSLNSKLFDTQNILLKKETSQQTAENQIHVCKEELGTLVKPNVESEIDVSSRNTQFIDLITNPLPNENLTFFNDLSENSPSLEVLTIPNQQNSMSLHCDVLNEPLVPEEVSVSVPLDSDTSIEASVIDKNFVLTTALINNNHQFEVEEDTNISHENLTNVEISNSLERIFTNCPAADITDASSEVKEKQADEITLSFVSDKDITSEPCVNVSTTDSTDIIMPGVTFENSKVINTFLSEGSVENVQQELCMENKEQISDSLIYSKTYDGDLSLGDKEVIEDVYHEVSHDHKNELHPYNQETVHNSVDYINDNENTMYLNEKDIVINITMDNSTGCETEQREVLNIPIETLESHEIESCFANGDTILDLHTNSSLSCEKDFFDEEQKIAVTLESISESHEAQDSRETLDDGFGCLESNKTVLVHQEDSSHTLIPAVDLKNTEGDFYMLENDKITGGMERNELHQRIIEISDNFCKTGKQDLDLKTVEDVSDILKLENYESDQYLKNGKIVTDILIDGQENDICLTEDRDISMENLENCKEQQFLEKFTLENICAEECSTSIGNGNLLQSSVPILNGGTNLLSLYTSLNFKKTSKARKSLKSKATIMNSSVKEFSMEIDEENSSFTTKLNLFKNTPCNVNVTTEDNVSNNTDLSNLITDSVTEYIPSEVRENMKADSLNFNHFISSELEITPSKKSRKSFPRKIDIDVRLNVSRAKKTCTGSRRVSSESSNSNRRSSDSCDRCNPTHSSSSADESDSMPLKQIKYDNASAVDVKDSLAAIDSSLNSTSSNAQAKCAALKTFKKPFTVAKKSVIEKTAFKSVIQSYFGVRTALKSFSKSSSPRVQNADSFDKDSSAIIISLHDKSDTELSPEELSADETKTSSGSWFPLKELPYLKSACHCSAEQVPCLCSGETLQLTCEAEDSVDGNTIACTESVSRQYLLTPSTKIKHRTFCDKHLLRLRKHHCCPRCGLFCTQGMFLHCSHVRTLKGGKENHLFHPSCFIIPDIGLPPSCPHCCKFSNFNQVQLSLVDSVKEPNASQDSTIYSNAENLTSELDNYQILMTTVDKEENLTNVRNSEEVPQKQELHTMIMAITKEKSLHLRPTGKCLFNPIKTGDVKKVLQLIVNGVDPNHKFVTHKNNTPLHVAAFYGFTGIVHVLLQYGASIDAVNDDLETPLVLAVEKNQYSVVKYLLFAGAQIDVKNENGLTAFHLAAKNNYSNIAKLLFDTGKFNINIQDDGGWTPLVWACEHNYIDLVKWFLELEADPNVRDNEENTALHWAAFSGDCEIIEMLLEKGCNLTFVNERGDSALHVAARKDHHACVKVLLSNGASLDCKNKDGETPMKCCDEGSKSLKFLKKHSLNSKKVERVSLQQQVVYRDISRGSEIYPIQAVNEVDQQEFIMEFRYITRNCFAPDINVLATIGSMKKCCCKDNCNSGNCSCTKISRCWYDMDGCLVSDFDLCAPPAIYECSKICHCPKTCINRVVQKGLRNPLQLFRTLNRGWGVRTLKSLPKGTFVCEYIGEVVTELEIAERTDDNYLFNLDSKDGNYCIDGRFFGNVARFINHNCEPNLVSIRVFVEHQDIHFPRIAFFTMRNVEAHEELCFDYGTEFWIAKCQTVLCTCNSKLCKYSKDSIDDTLQAYACEKEANMHNM